MNKIKLKVLYTDLFLLLGCVFGVGFATGSELEQFFLTNFRYFLLGLVLAIALFNGLIVLILKLREKFKINGIKSFNVLIFKKYADILDVILVFALIIVSACMLSGANSVCFYLFKIKFPICSIILCFIGYFVVNNGIRSIKKLSKIIVPILIVLIFYNVFKSKLYLYANCVSRGGLIQSLVLPVLYVSYNMLIGLNVIFKINLDSKKTLSYFSFILFFAILFICNTIRNVYGSNMPLLFISNFVGSGFVFVYSIGIFLSLISTFVISENSVAEIMNLKTKFSIMVVILITQIISFLGFNFIIKYLYTVVGILALLYFLIVAVRGVYLLKKTNRD